MKTRTWIALLASATAIVVATIEILPKLLSGDESPVIASAQADAPRAIPSAPPLRAPFALDAYYFPSGWIGDAEHGKRYVELDPHDRTTPRDGDTDGVVVKTTYRPGPQGWASVYWQWPEGNWGKQPGYAVTADRVSFLARGKAGGELIEYRIGGIGKNGTERFSDTVDRSTGRIALTTEWRRFEIPLAGEDLSRVIGGFSWTAVAAANPTGVVFYMDDIKYE